MLEYNPDGIIILSLGHGLDRIPDLQQILDKEPGVDTTTSQDCKHDSTSTIRGRHGTAHVSVISVLCLLLYLRCIAAVAAHASRLCRQGESLVGSMQDLT